MIVKTLAERERELQTLMRTPAGRAELDDLAAAYAAEATGPHWHTSVITYILVHERQAGAIRP
ncbi:MAG TPA: hypothetical protein VGF55_17475 [Gemmataceae bacterium]|jgi:hypothetical protein